jgi:hypothetical protein
VVLGLQPARLIESIESIHDDVARCGRGIVGLVRSIVVELLLLACGGGSIWPG